MRYLANMVLLCPKPPQDAEEDEARCLPFGIRLESGSDCRDSNV